MIRTIAAFAIIGLYLSCFPHAAHAGKFREALSKSSYNGEDYSGVKKFKKDMHKTARSRTLDKNKISDEARTMRNDQTQFKSRADRHAKPLAKRGKTINNSSSQGIND